MTYTPPIRRPAPTKFCAYCGSVMARPNGLSEWRWSERKYCGPEHALLARREGSGHVAQPDEDLGFQPDPLVAALLQYGLKHDTDLGMGALAFLDRCREYRVAA
jgi:hypothetical protein